MCDKISTLSGISKVSSNHPFMAFSAVLDDQIDALLSVHGLRRTKAARAVLGYLVEHAEMSLTHAQLQLAVQEQEECVLDRGTLYRLVDRLTQVGLLVCRVDVRGVRRYQSVRESSYASPHFECHSCHRDQSLTGGLESKALALQKAAQAALTTLVAMGCKDLSLDLAVRGVCADCARMAGQVSA